MCVYRIDNAKNCFPLWFLAFALRCYEKPVTRISTGHIVPPSQQHKGEFMSKIFQKFMTLFATTIAAVTMIGSSGQAQLADKPVQLADKPVQLADVQKQKMTEEIGYIGSIYREHYAPKSWKESHLGWNLEAEVKEAQDKILVANSMHDSRMALVDFLNSTADYHVFYSFFSTGRSVLPIQVKTVEGKTIIVFINREKLPETTFPFAVGDELVAMDGVEVSQTLKILERLVGPNVPETDLALADLYLTARIGSAAAVVPTGPVALTILRSQETKPVTHQLVWEHTPEMIKFSNSQVMNLKNQSTDADSKKKVKLNLPKMQSPHAKNLVVAENTWGLGTRKSMLPDLGKRIWESEKENEFDAYIYKNEQGKLIGVVRIPSYSPENDDVEKAIKDFTAVMKKMNDLVDGLVIDQLNNPGGYVFYLYAMASMFTDTSISTPKHRMSISAYDVQDAVSTLKDLSAVKNNEQAIEKLGERVNGYPNSYQMVVNIREYCRFIIDQWNAGKKLTDAFYLWGVDRINAHPEVQFTKPVIILVNELDFSGGDFFPAIMQDNKRVTVVGTRTAGAGGYVLQATFPNSFGLELLSFTGSIAERVDLNPIENLGVTPDISLQLTIEDLREDFKNYLKTVRETIDSKLTETK